MNRKAGNVNEMSLALQFFYVVCDSTSLNSVAARLGLATIILSSARKLSHKINALGKDVPSCYFCFYMVNYFDMVRGDTNKLLI